MERDKPKRLEEEEMDTSGHGDKLQAAMDKVADPSDKPEPERDTQVDEEDMDTTGHGDPGRRLLSKDS